MLATRLGLNNCSFNPFSVLTILTMNVKYRGGPERSKTEKGREGPALALSAGAQTVFLLEMEDLGTYLLLCPGKMFSQGN